MCACEILPGFFFLFLAMCDFAEDLEKVDVFYFLLNNLSLAVVVINACLQYVRAAAVD